MLAVRQWFSDLRYSTTNIIYVNRIELCGATFCCSSLRFNVGSPKITPPHFSRIAVTAFVWNSSCPKQYKEYVFIRSREFVQATSSFRIDYA